MCSNIKTDNIKIIKELVTNILEINASTFTLIFTVVNSILSYLRLQCIKVFRYCFECALCYVCHISLYLAVMIFHFHEQLALSGIYHVGSLALCGLSRWDFLMLFACFSQETLNERKVMAHSLSLQRLESEWSGALCPTLPMQ